VKIAILETGRPPEPLVERFGTYAGMLTRMVEGAGLTAETAVFDVQDGAWPERPDSFDAYLITGSPAGVYDGERWIADLKSFLVSARGEAKMVGVCFGHQVMAEAFGGKVIKSPKGWGVGLHAYEVRSREPWMDDAVAIRVPVSHQDQVVEVPPSARVVAGSAFTPYGALAYDGYAVSFQCHPEFDPVYAAALAERRRGGALSDAEVDAAVESLKAPNDNARVGGWIGTFLKG
jgi:GMP synthase-like glutamine amidotransferase